MHLKRQIHPIYMNEAGGENAPAGGDTTPGATSTSEVTDGGADTGIDFESLMGDMDDDAGVGEVSGAPSDATPAATPAPVAAAPAVAPAPVAASAVSVATAAPASPSAAEPVSPQAQEQAREQVRQGAYDSLSASWKTQLTPEVVDSIMTNPAEMLPQLMAQVELRALETTMAHVQTQIPQMIQRFVADVNHRNGLEQTFYTEYPFLKEHEADVLAAVSQQKGLPGFDFSRPEVRKAVAGIVVAAKGLYQQAMGQAAPAPAAQPRRPTPTPAPAGSTASGAAPAPTQSGEIDWTSLLDDD